MTGITKDELMQMAQDAGLIDFYNAILERAAAECDATKTRYKGMAEEEDKTLLKAGECSDYWSHVSALAGAAYDIRALKINRSSFNRAANLNFYSSNFIRIGSIRQYKISQSSITNITLT